MDHPISLRILKIILMITYGYKKCCNVSQIIYRGCMCVCDLHRITCETAIQLREKGKVVVADTTLQYLGSVHLKSGVLDPHFEVVKEALVRTLKEGLGKKYNEEVEGAWSQAYDHLALAIKAEMKQENSQKP
ncbi:BnaA01g31630D [Brassica napus]|uniref:BnaA01g31630D protein n=1 Tax=Brassica napus TaxID=3708 RepID=A0A078HUH0_BRANA|nr:BnaA01g31630D [Brassica napus]